MWTNLHTLSVFPLQELSLTQRFTPTLVCLCSLCQAMKESLGKPRHSGQARATIYQAVFLPTFSCGVESWAIYSRHLKTLEQYQKQCLHKILRISWKERKTNVCVLTESNIPTITTTIIEHQLQWIGHILRMPSNAIALWLTTVKE